MTLLTDRETVERPTMSTLRPRFEGSNICTWIGFKHVNYLVEEAVLDHFRQVWAGPRTLFEEYGVGLDVTDIDTRILHALHSDDEVTATVSAGKPVLGKLSLKVVIEVARPGGVVKAVSSKVSVVLRRDDRHPSVPPSPLPAGLAEFAVDQIGTGELVTLPAGPLGRPAGRGSVSQDVPAELRKGDGPAIAWSWRIPYFYCHHTVRLQMSGLLRQMEEVVDLFLQERGVSIRTLLDEQDWIPVVPHSRISMIGEALMEEELITVFEVESVFKDATYTARMDCYAVRAEGLVKVATGVITHGYALIDGRTAWALVAFDERMMAAVGAA
jgi:acyl-CoA thioesterase FadM